MTNQNTYDYLFKYIIVGDSSKQITIETLGSPAYYHGSSMEGLKMILSQP